MRDNDTIPGFLESEIGRPGPEGALFHVIPAPYEKSVSYGTGTSLAPDAVLVASQQLELFDGVSVPAECGIFTRTSVDCGGSHEDALERINDALAVSMNAGHIPVMIGGEHTVTNAVLPILGALPGEIGIIQFDAHADLRESYQGSRFSHACVMHQAHRADFPVFQIAVRSMSTDEHTLRESTDSISYFDAHEIAEKGIDSLAFPESFPETVYITFDIDAFDPSVMPATGTPEPGGLTWFQAMKALELICAAKRVVGMDVVELAPLPGLHFADYTAARLMYNAMGFISRSPFYASR